MTSNNSNKQTGRPNILLIMADQLAPQFLPCYGHPVVKAPAIDRLAREGVVFDAAYTNSPLCAPSRFVMMSGRLPSSIAAWDNAVDFSAEIPTFAHYLEAEGYKTCLSGKMHFVGPDQLHGFRQRLTTDVYPADYTWHPEWDRPGERLDWYHNMDVVLKAGPCVRSLYLDYDDEAVFEAKRFIFDEAREGDGDPWMLTVSMIQPHDPYLCRQEKWDQYDDGNIDLPATPLGKVAEDPHAARLRHGYGATDEDFDDQTIRNARRAYYGSIGDIDDKIADLVAAVEEAGQKDNTVIIVTADHGDMLGERGMWFKMTFFEHSARVPLIIHAPTMFSPHRVSEAVSHVDFLPTFIELARDGRVGNYVTPIEGRSLLPHLNGTGGHDEVIGEYYAECTTAPIFMVRRGTKKLIHCSTDPDQYYDVVKDPNENNNLAHDDTHSDTIDGITEELARTYDTKSLTERVLESQHRRKFLKTIMRDNDVSWDYQPHKDASKAYIRNTVPLYQIEKRGRFPTVT